MNKPGDNPPPQPSTEEGRESTEPSERPATISYDERGNSVWEWQLETGVYSRDVNTQRLKKLDLDDLSIADTAKHQRPPGLDDPPTK